MFFVHNRSLDELVTVDHAIEPDLALESVKKCCAAAGTHHQGRYRATHFTSRTPNTINVVAAKANPAQAGSGHEAQRKSTDQEIKRECCPLKGRTEG